MENINEFVRSAHSHPSINSPSGRLLKQLKERALADIKAAADTNALYKAEVVYLGRKGELTMLFKELASLSGDDKKHMGMMCNEVKNILSEAVAEKAHKLENKDIESKLAASDVDITMPGTK